jgi:hypothetical protein
LIPQITFCKDCKSWSSSLCSFLQSPVTSSHLCPNTFLSTLCSNTLSLCSCFNTYFLISLRDKCVTLTSLFCGTASVGDWCTMF